MAIIFNTVTAAQELQCSPATISRWATKLGIGQDVGPSRIFTKADLKKIEKCKKDSVGNPNFGSKPKGK